MPVNDPSAHHPTDRKAVRRLIRKRRLAGYLGAFSLLCLIGLGFGELADVDREVDPKSIDEIVRQWTLRHRLAYPAVTATFRTVTRLGDIHLGPIMIVLSAAVMAVWSRRRMPGIGPRVWSFFLLANLGARLLVVALKEWFQRERPPLIHMLVEETSFSFPSGHSLSSAAFFTLWAIVFSRAARNEPRWVTLAWWALCMLMTAAIGSSRVWLGAHYATDVLGGWLLGIVWGLACGAIHFGGSPRPDSRTPADEPVSATDEDAA